MAKKKSSPKVSEERLPELARAATRSAHRKAVRSGSVLVYNNGELRKIEAGGKASVIKKLEPRRRIRKGSTFEIEPEAA
jgi:hypothetical protein